MATENDDTKETKATKKATKKVAKKASKKTVAKKATVKKSTKKATKKVAKKTAAKKAGKKSASESTSSGNFKNDSSFNERVSEESQKAGNKSDEFFEHSIKAFDELSQAASVATDCVVEKLDKATLKARLEAKEAYAKGKEDVVEFKDRAKEWVNKNPVASSLVATVATSAAAGVLAAAAKGVFKRKR